MEILGWCWPSSNSQHNNWTTRPKASGSSVGELRWYSVERRWAEYLIRLADALDSRQEELLFEFEECIRKKVELLCETFCQDCEFIPQVSVYPSKIFCALHEHGKLVIFSKQQGFFYFSTTFSSVTCFRQSGKSRLTALPFRAFFTFEVISLARERDQTHQHWK